MRTTTCLRTNFFVAVVLGTALWGTLAAPVTAQVVSDGGAEGASVDNGVIPGNYQGAGSFFNRELGTAFRLNYHTESYGVNDGVVALGAMKVFDLDGATWFIDGQATLSDDFGGGYNLGIVYRELAEVPIFNYDTQRILGVGFWTDGQSTSADNFFTQLGFSLESLGDSYDLRLNGSFPLERTQTGDATITSIGAITQIGNNLFAGTQSNIIDTAHTVIDGELAKRIANLEAWAFVGGYHVGGGGLDNGGFRAGVRGYAVPDLALSLQVTDDDVFSTNVVFAMTWFVGRTHKGNQPVGTLVDRFREPVLRNDYIVTTSRAVSSASSTALTDSETNNALRISYVNSNAAAGGDGTIENPYNTLTAAQVGSLADDKILVYSGSVFTSETLLLKSGQDLLGEGLDAAGAAVTHSVNTVERGLVTLPETSVGASLGAAPILNSLAGADALTFADNSTANNFVINGGARAVVANGIAAPTGSMLANLRLNNQTGDSVFLQNTTGLLIVDNSVAITGAGGAAVLVDGGSAAMNINAAIANTAGSALTIRNRSGGTLTYGGTIDDNGGDGITIDSNTGSTIVLSNASNSVTNGIDLAATGTADALAISNNTNSTINFTGTLGIGATGTNRGVVISGNDVNTTVSFTDLDATATNGNAVTVLGDGTVSFASVGAARGIESTGTGAAFLNDGTTGSATITVSSNIDSSGTGRSVDIQNRSQNNSVTLSGTVDDTGAGILVMNNTDGSIGFNGQTTVTVTGTTTGVDLDTNTGARIGFFGGLSVTSTAGGTAFRAVGGGDLAVSGTGNELTSATGLSLDLQGLDINASGVTFDTVDVTAGGAGAINLQNLAGAGQIVLGSGTNAGDGGTLSTATTAITVDNVNSLLIQNVTVNTTTGNAIDVTHTGTATSDVDFNNVTAVSGDSVGINILANGTGEFDLTIDNSTIGSVTGTEGILLDTGANAGRVDFILTNSTVTADNDEAFRAVLNDSDTAVVTFVLDNNDFTNKSVGSGATVDISVTSGMTLNARIGSLFAGEDPPTSLGDNNRIINNGASGDSLDITLNHATGVINLDLRDNTAQFGGVGYVLNETNGDFNLVDSADTLSGNNNVGTFMTTGTFDNFVPPVVAPTP